MTSGQIHIILYKYSQTSQFSTAILAFPHRVRGSPLCHFKAHRARLGLLSMVRCQIIVQCIHPSWGILAGSWKAFHTIHSFSCETSTLIWVKIEIPRVGLLETYCLILARVMLCYCYLSWFHYNLTQGGDSGSKIEVLSVYLQNEAIYGARYCPNGQGGSAKKEKQS